MATRVVIVGAGIGGVPAAYALRRRLGSDAKITVVSALSNFEFVPSHPWVALGWRDARRIAFPIAPYFAACDIDFIAVAVQRFDAARNCLQLADGRKIDYDFLVIATGPEAGFDEVPGLGAKTTACSVMRTHQAVAAHAAYRHFVTEPGPIVVGAAPHAAILGPVYEMAFLIDADLRRRQIRQRVSITIVSPEPYAGHLGLGGQGESRALLEQALAQNDIRFIGDAATDRVEPGCAHISRGENGAARTETLPFSYSVYWPPFRGVAALRRAEEMVDARGFVEVDEYLRARRHENVFALGVCVARAPVAETAVPIGAPESVYSIQGEVGTVVDNIAASLRGAPLLSAATQRAQWIADLGETGAAYLSAPHVPLKQVNWLRQGTWVHLAKAEFEKYFISKIKLGATADDAAARSRLAGTVSELASERREGERAASFAGPLRQLSVPLEAESAYTLSAMAKVLRCDAMEVAGALLKAAIQDAENYVPPDLRDELAQARRETLIAQLPGKDPATHFQGGAP